MEATESVACGGKAVPTASHMHNATAGDINEAQILVRKMRNKAAGTIGEVTLVYDRVTGRFNDADSHSSAGDPPANFNSASRAFKAK